MPTIVGTLRDELDLSAEMARIRNRFDTQRCSPSAFNYRHDGELIIIEVQSKMAKPPSASSRFLAGITVLPGNASAGTRLRQ